MAFEGKDGKKFSMSSRMRAHNRSTEAKGGGTATKAPEQILDAPSEDGQEDGMLDEQPEKVVEQHGPATEVHVTHDHEMETHHVHSMHADGHEHHSDHASPEEAHEHGKKLSMEHEGGGANEHEDEYEGDEY